MNAEATITWMTKVGRRGLDGMVVDVLQATVM